MNHLALLLSAILLAFPAFAQSNWEKTIQAFEEQDAENPPEKGGILFVGSSSIRAWKTDRDFPELDIVNRGFGGSQTSDVLYFMDRIVFPYEPRLIVVYVGDNDFAYGKSVERVWTDTTTFIETVHERLPETRIVYVAIKPSLARWNLVEKMRALNAKVQERAETDPLLDYLDIDTPMIGEDGRPRPELFIKDGLHMSEEGYALWNDLVRPYLVKPDAND